MSVVLLLTATAMLCALQHMALKLPLLAPAAEARSVGYSWYLSPPLFSAQLSSCRISWQRRIGVQRGVRLAGVRVGDAACRRRAAAGPAGACVAIALLLAARDADHHPASKLPRTSRRPSGCSVLLSRQPTNQPPRTCTHSHRATCPASRADICWPLACSSGSRTRSSSTPYRGTGASNAESSAARQLLESNASGQCAPGWRCTLYGRSRPRVPSTSRGSRWLPMSTTPSRTPRCLHMLAFCS